MIGKMVALREVNRLKPTNFFATLDEDGIRELARMLGFADTEAIAMLVINEWLENQKGRPTPADLRALVAAQNEAHRDRQAAASAQVKELFRCDKCTDSGLCGGDAQPWAWCECVEGRRRREVEPSAVDDSNAVRTKLINSTRKPKSIPHIVRPVQTVYPGDYR